MVKICKFYVSIAKIDPQTKKSWLFSIDFFQIFDDFSKVHLGNFQDVFLCLFSLKLFLNKKKVYLVRSTFLKNNSFWMYNCWLCLGRAFYIHIIRNTFSNTLTIYKRMYSKKESKVSSYCQSLITETVIPPAPSPETVTICGVAS